jgi:hypothetical protein
MAQSYFPFDSGRGANITENQWSKMARLWAETGVIKGYLNALLAFADSTGMQTKVNTGAAWIKGHYYESDAIETLPIGTADSVNPRIDRIVVRLDWVENTVQLAVIQGSPAVTPSAPALTQNSSRWEIPIAQVRVDAGVTTIAAGKITDERRLIQNVNQDDIEYTVVSGVNVNGSTGVINARKIRFKMLGISIVHLYLNLTNIMDAGTKGSISTSYAPNGGRYESGMVIVPNDAAASARIVHVYSDGTIGVMGTSGSNHTYYGTVVYMREG